MRLHKQEITHRFFVFISDVKLLNQNLKIITFLDNSQWEFSTIFIQKSYEFKKALQWLNSTTKTFVLFIRQVLVVLKKNLWTLP